MAEPMFTGINMEDKPDKIVGRRRAIKDTFKAGMTLQETTNDLRKAFGHGFVPKGVFRFRTHEEADEWMLKMLARRPKS